jgi:hypothetical protein
VPDVGSPEMCDEKGAPGEVPKSGVIARTAKMGKFYKAGFKNLFK